MGQSAIKNPRRIVSQPGGGGADPALEARVEYLEDNEYKITYYAEINTSTGTITKPTGSTILLDQFFGGVDAYVSTIAGGQPTGDFPTTAGGVAVDVSSFDTMGNFTLSGTPSSYPVALIYILKIKAKDYSNLDITKILDLENINAVPYIGATANVDLGTNDLIFGAASGILLNNSSRLREGTIDAGFGGSKGIAQICAVGYELKWEAGRLYVMDGNGILIRHSLYNFTTVPSVNDDDTKGYYVGSLWTLDNGTIYTCSDSTTGAAVWDLNSGFVPYTGATANVDLGEFEIKAGQVEFDQTPTGTAGVAVMRWNNTDGTLDLGLKGGNVTLQVGQEQVLRVVNKTGSPITNGQVVRVVAVAGGVTGVALAKADSEANSETTIGIATEDIADNAQGFITSQGLVHDVNTNSFNEGDVLYLSPITAGGITNIKPVAPQHMVIVGYVAKKGIADGHILVQVQNGYELQELHNVYINPATLADNDVLQYDSATSLWENKPIVTPNNSASNLFNYYNFI